MRPDIAKLEDWMQRITESTQYGWDVLNTQECESLAYELHKAMSEVLPVLKFYKAELERRMFLDYLDDWRKEHPDWGEPDEETREGIKGNATAMVGAMLRAHFLPHKVKT